MVQKRPFDEDESNEFSSKQPRQMELNGRLVSALEFPSGSVVRSCHTSGDNDSTKFKPEGDGKVDISYNTELRFCTGKDVEIRVPAPLPSSSWVTSSTSEDVRLEEPFRIMLSPDFHNSEHPPRSIVHRGEIYSFLLDQPPRKLVHVGSCFQADIPEWAAPGSKNMYSCSKHMEEAPNVLSQALDYDEKKLSGTCVVPMPDSDLPAENGDVGVGKIGCLCEDVGSIRCVQQHVMEAREKLDGTFGPETFAELGFCDMGEIVAQKWSEEEENLFCEVVFSNPASLGNNFWNHLAVVFPSRSKSEIVSYYFNVFMLRRRAEQNRFDPLNIDSDDDEWLGTGDSTDNEIQDDEDDDAVVESPIDSDTSAYAADPVQSAPGDCSPMDGDSMNASEACKSKLHVKCSSDTGHFSTDTGSGDGQDGSSTSGDTGVGSQPNMEEKADGNKHWAGHFTGTNAITGHEFMLEACNAREWEIGYLTRPRNEVDLLPTCNMIEEVFGAGSWDGQDLN